MDSYGGASGPIAALLRELDIHSSVGAPIIVDGRQWGVAVVSSRHEQLLPPDTEARIAAFTELVATAVSNSEARAETTRLTDEQAALRRVATLVAQSVAPHELFDAVTEEVGTLLDVDLAGMTRFVGEEGLTAVATWAARGEHPDVPGVWTVSGDRISPAILQTGRPAREDDWDTVEGPSGAFIRDQLGVRCSVASPIIVEGRTWGGLWVHSTTTRSLPADTEARLGNFTELVATAISNAQARADVRRLADEQAALRRVATLVARESPPDEVFAAVAEEVGLLLGVQDTRIIRYEPDETVTVMANWGELESGIPVGSRWQLDGQNVATMVFRTGRAARKDDYKDASGSIGDQTRQLGIRSAVGTPIVVEGRLWGAMLAGSLTAEALPAETESRIREFTALIATAISNIQARSDLAASRARIVASADEERRRVVRDLHDGAQQRLVHTIVTLKQARAEFERDPAIVRARVTEALENAEQATLELRELSHGIMPAVLTRGGVRAAVEALASRSPVPVDVDVSVGRLPAHIEATAYFVVAEALTNVSKHAQATTATACAHIVEDRFRIEVRDDGVGGARPECSGLLGLRDRLAVHGGRLRIESPQDAGTRLVAEIPLL
jgi:signal transduction histidine kinase